MTIELKGTHPTAHRIFVRFSDEDKDTVWITDGRGEYDFYGSTVSLPTDVIDQMIEALLSLKKSAGVETRHST